MSDGPDEEPRRRTGPEWVTFVVSLVILGALVALIARDLAVEEQPADPVAAVVGEPRKVGDHHVLTVEVENRGDGTALAVRVLAELELEGETFEDDQEVEQLAGHATEEIEFVFPADPADGEITVRVGGFQHP